MKIEVGMYVRTKIGIIDKIIDIKFNDNYNTEPSQILLERHKGYIEHKNHNVKKENNMLIIDDDTKTYWFSATEILKSSHNIIDLIEVRDYINGYKVLYQADCYSYFDIDTCEWVYIKNTKDIKTILTKEQFEREAYKI